MMSKEEHIAYWLKSAIDDLDTAEYNKKGGKNLPALFFYHLTIEKILKANWVKDNVSNIPPFTHDLKGLLEGCNIELNSEDFDYLSIIQGWQIEGRYPSFKNILAKNADMKYMNLQSEKIKNLFQCLKSKI